MYRRFIKNFCTQKKDSKVIENQNLKSLTTFKIDSIARVFVNITNLYDLKLLLTLAKNYNLKTFCLGGGSKVLFCKKKLKYIIYTLSGEFEKIIYCEDCLVVGGGASMSKLCGFCNKNNLSCVEWGFGIPCKIGGGIHTNAGCFGKSFSDIVKYVVYTDGNEIFVRSKSQCEFGYRTSFFYGKSFTILFAVLGCEKSGKDIKKITIDNFNKKVALQPYDYPSVGSIFKSSVLPAPIFIENFGLKGLKIGGAEVSNKHCGFVINKKNAKATDVLKIICKIKKTVWKKGGIILYNEVILLGDKNNGFFG